MAEPVATFINPTSLAPARGYSNGVLMPPGRILFVAGQIGWDAHARIVSNEFAAQFRQALINVLDVVKEAGGGPENIGRFTLYVTDKKRYMACSREIGEHYRAVMGRHFPAMALVEVQSLLEPEALVEIEATAVLA